MADDQYGQICGDCNGSCVKEEQKAMILEDSTVTTTIVVGACPSCQGTGWLGGRAR